MKPVFLSILLTLAFVGLDSIAFGQNPDAQPPMQGSPDLLKQIGIDQKLNADLPLDLKFTDDNGTEIQLRQFFADKPVIILPVYYSCASLCTLSLNGLVNCLNQVGENPGKDFIVLAVSFDPRETADLAARKKASYMELYARPGTESGWHFLTGNEPAIKELMASIGFRYAWDEAGKQYAHASAIILATPQGKVSRYFYGVEYPSPDVVAALGEAKSSKIGKAADPVILYCWSFDAKTGKYTLIVRNAVKAGFVLTTLGLGGFILLMVRRDSRRRKEGPAAVNSNPA